MTHLQQKVSEKPELHDATQHNTAGGGKIAFTNMPAKLWDLVLKVRLPGQSKK